jgi:predicted nucleic acid-binding protein
MIACDTSALSHFFRRSTDSEGAVARVVGELIDSNSLALFGIVRQELLSGIKLATHFDQIQLTTQALPLFLADDKDHTTAATFFNTCRSQGIQGSPIDFLICAMSVRRNFSIYTTDPDFKLYEPHLPIELYRP